MVDKVQSCCFRMVVKVQMVDKVQMVGKVQSCCFRMVVKVQMVDMGSFMGKVHYCQNCQGKLVSHMDQIFERNYLVRKSLIDSNCSFEDR